MNILCVDPSDEVLQALRVILPELHPEASLFLFGSSPEALAAAREHEMDIAFLNPSLPELSGLDLGRYLSELNPLLNVIYLAETPDYGFEALQMHASGYLLLPAEPEAIRRELSDLRHPDILRNSKRVFAQTFGNFELFVDGKPVSFKYNKTKEIVAVLVNNNGALTTNGEIIACLWEDDGDPEKKASYLSNLRQDLQNTFTRLRLNGIILKQRGSMAIARDRIECDVYDWMEKKKESRYQYLGDYMAQYSWPEFRHAELDEIYYSMEDDL